MSRTRVQELGQQGHYCQFGDCKREDTGAESGHGVFDNILFVLQTEGIEMTTAA
jgi:hypothetical protein